jgi:hypothetical protein
MLTSVKGRCGQADTTKTTRNPLCAFHGISKSRDIENGAGSQPRLVICLLGAQALFEAIRVFYCHGLDLKCPSKFHVLTAASPVKQCSELGFEGSDWLLRALSSLIDYPLTSS